MNDNQLDKLLDASRASWRVPPEPPLDELWPEIRRRRSGRGPVFGKGWRIMGVAASLILAFGLGRYSSSGVTVPADTTVASAQRVSMDRPIEETTTLLLGESVVLLSTLPMTESSPATDRHFADQAREMLSTTRLLLDSRAAANPRLKELLEDLEFVLAQIARLQNAPSREELDIITDALQQQDIVPRIRSIAAGLSAGDDD
ncbi:MAG: hypothetical protein ACT4OZ_15495 [Gemmatimonadota bacterium]